MERQTSDFRRQSQLLRPMSGVSYLSSRSLSRLSLGWGIRWVVDGFRIFGLRDADALHAALRGLQDLETQAFDFDDFAGRRDMSGKLGDEATDRSRFPVAPADTEDLL